MKLKAKITGLLFSILLLVACSKDNDDIEKKEFEFDPIANIADYRGELSSEQVVVYAQGGPEIFLDPFEVEAVITTTNTQELLTINVHQAQSLDPGLIDQEDISFDQAIALDQISVENLEEVIAHLHNSGKKVYLVGTSFGGFLVQKYMADYGIDRLEAILVVASRLNIQEGFWMGFSMGQTGRFESDGINWSLMEQNDPLNRNISRLAAGVGKNRYIDLFANLNGLAKLTFVFSTQDDRIGTLDNDEKSFLISKSVNLIPIEASHSETVVSGIKRGYAEGLQLGN